MKTTAPAGGARRRVRGNALLEFLLTIPIIVFVAGLTITMSVAMLAKQQAVMYARVDNYNASHCGWSAMKLEGWDPSQTAPGAGGANLPRGYGEDLDRLRPEIEPSTIARSPNPAARDLWERLWDNLPGRLTTSASKSFTTMRAFNFIRGPAQAEHQRDSSPWHFYHLDFWRIVRSGPLSEEFSTFRQAFQFNGAQLAPHVRPTCDDIYKRWWDASDLMGNLPAGG